MFAVIYSFHIKAGHEDSFISAWENMTLLIKKYCGGQGSRLHKCSDSRHYIAYAQWPSKDFWERDAPPDFPEVGKQYKQEMLAACINRETLFDMEMVSDLLQPL